jgi:ankyrin repeat protein
MVYRGFLLAPVVVAVNMPKSFLATTLPAVVKQLLEKGAELETKDNYGQTPLSWAARHEHKAVARMLLEKGSIPVDDNERYPILVYMFCASASIRFDCNINPIPYLCEAKREL